MSQAATISGTTLVAASDDIYQAGGQTDGANGGAPVAITLPSGASSMTFLTTGTIILNVGTGNNVNDPDGVGAAANFSLNTGYGSISGISAPNAGFLVGVFVPAGGPSGPPPTALAYTTATIASPSFSPLLDQTFFIGDGLTGDGTGNAQVFYLPAGAATLYLGISDASGYDGPPGAYGDNSGTFASDYTITTPATPSTATPEPTNFTLLLAGSAAFAFWRRRF